MTLESLKNLLKLSVEKPRKFCVCLSGGVDSTVLLHLMKKLSKEFPIELQALHLNYGLRGQESERDEKFVRALCKKLSVELTIKHFKVLKRSSIQEWARSERLRAIDELPPDVEILEAHHQDDQIETFFLNLFRGAGIKGLSSLKPVSKREGRYVWRPLIDCSKEQLRAFARKKRITHCEDSTNQTTAYDRNFVRRSLIPLIESRFPASRRSIVSAISLLRSLEQELQDRNESLLANPALVLSWDPLELHLGELSGMKHFERASFLHYLVAARLKIQVSRKQIDELTDACLRPAPWAVNLPQNIVVRAKARKRLVFQGLKRVLGSDKSDSDIILRVLHERRN